MIVQPLDATRLNHPMAFDYRLKCAPSAAFTMLRDAFGPTDDLASAEWVPIIGSSTELKLCGPAADARPAPLTEAEQSRVDVILAQSWDACAAHLPLDEIIGRQWLVYVSSWICLFLPAQENEIRADAFPQPGRDHLISWSGCRPPAPSVDLLPFVPIAEGRVSRHADLRSRQMRNHDLKRLLSVALPTIVDILPAL